MNSTDQNLSKLTMFFIEIIIRDFHCICIEQILYWIEYKRKRNCP